MELVFITGASRGYGRALALAFARSASAPTTLVLLARGAAGLESTRAAISSAAPAVACVCLPVDLADLPLLAVAWDGLLAQLPGPWSRAFLLNNAGGAGRVGYVRDFELSPAGLAAARATLDLDVLSPWILTSLFLRAVKARVPPPRRWHPPGAPLRGGQCVLPRRSGALCLPGALLRHPRRQGHGHARGG